MLGTAAIVAGGSLLGGAMESSSQEDINEQNLQYARRNTLYQTHMSNTAYQRAVEDMKKAGINPMMAATKGGASTPTGMTPQLGNEKAAIGRGFANAARAVGMEIPMNQANIDNTDAGTAVKEEEKKNKAKERQVMDANIKVAQASAKNIHEQTRLTGAKADVAGVIQPYTQVAAEGGKKLVAEAKKIGTKPADAVYDAVHKPVSFKRPDGATVRYPNGIFAPGEVVGAGTATSQGVAAPYGGKNSAK